MTSSIPEELSYTSDHEWVQRKSETVVRIGITDFAQDALGDVVFVQLPELDAETTSGESFAEVESTKSVSDIYAPLSGVVAAVNGELDSSPDLINSDPYGEGWIVEISASSPEELDGILEGMLDAEAYKSLTSG